MTTIKDADGELLWCRCMDCGVTWMMDYEPTPEFCADAPWSLGISSDEGSAIVWGQAVDPDGNAVEI